MRFQVRVRIHVLQFQSLDSRWLITGVDSLRKGTFGYSGQYRQQALATLTALAARDVLAVYQPGGTSKDIIELTYQCNGIRSMLDSSRRILWD